MQNKTGQAVSGDDFFPRPREIKKIRLGLHNGSHMLLAAPRRVGKTSLLFHLQDIEEQTPFYFVWVITESIDSEETFFQRLFHAVMKCDATTAWQRLGNRTRSFFKETSKYLTSLDVPGGVSLKLDQTDKIPYRQRFIKLIRELPLESGKRIVFMIDEFPATLENIVRQQGETSAISFLQANRELRQNQELSKKVQFILTGSIGLEHVVGSLNQTNLINDLVPVEIKPLKREEAVNMVARLAESSIISLEMAGVEYLVDMVSWRIPYFLQVLFHELVQVCIDEGEEQGSKQLLDLAFEAMLKRAKYFRSWEERLKKAFNNGKLRFVRDLLKQLSGTDFMADGPIFDLTVKHGISDYMPILDTLRHDGYLWRDTQGYRFISPVLKRWWFIYGRR